LMFVVVVDDDIDVVVVDDLGFLFFGDFHFLNAG